MVNGIALPFAFVKKKGNHRGYHSRLKAQIAPLVGWVVPYVASIRNQSVPDVRVFSRDASGKLRERVTWPFLTLHSNYVPICSEVPVSCVGHFCLIFACTFSSSLLSFPFWVAKNWESQSRRPFFWNPSENVTKHLERFELLNDSRYSLFPQHERVNRIAVNAGWSVKK